MTGDLAHLRREFCQSGLRRNELNASPIMQFSQWFEQAKEAGIVEPSAMSLATADEDNIGVRTVLLKFFDEKGFVFFTNYDSIKSHQLGVRAQAALLFPWLALERQVKIMGRVERVSTLESIKYFASRSKGSQLGAWASQQSSRISSRSLLLSQFESMKNKFASGEVPLPDFWGGYRVIPESIEFWQGRENRLHDRFIYRKEEGEWVVSRLSP